MAQTNVVLVSRDEINRNNKKVQAYAVFAYNMGTDNVLKTKPLRYFSEVELVVAASQGQIAIWNAIVENNRLKGNMGSLDRFEAVNGIKPVVVMARCYDMDDNVVGYRVLGYNSKNELAAMGWNLKKMDAYCKYAKEKNVNAPIQNMMIKGTSDDGHVILAVYPGTELYKEVLKPVKEAKVTVDKSAIVSVQEDNKAKTKSDVLYDRLSPEQKKIVDELKAKNLDWVSITNPKLSAKQLKVLADALKENQKIKQGLHYIATKSELSVEQMERLSNGLVTGVNIQYLPYFAKKEFDAGSITILNKAAKKKMGNGIRYMLNPKLNKAQITQIYNGLVLGIDVSQYADENLTPMQMSEICSNLSVSRWNQEGSISISKEDLMKQDANLD